MKGSSLVAFYFFSILLLLFINLFICGLGIINGSSMEPALPNGSLVVIVKPFYKPQVHDVVVTNSANPLETSLTKRVLAIGGQHVEITDEGVFVDSVKQDAAACANADVISVTVPEGEVFLLSDNMAGSIDSRQIGCIPESDIIGKVVFHIQLPNSKSAQLKI